MKAVGVVVKGNGSGLGLKGEFKWVGGMKNKQGGGWA